MRLLEKPLFGRRAKNSHQMAQRRRRSSKKFVLSAFQFIGIIVAGGVRMRLNQIVLQLIDLLLQCIDLLLDRWL